jgi:uncharacterized membrane protein YbhN (UPF0104 family)
MSHPERPLAAYNHVAAVFAPDQTLSELTLPDFDVRTAARRLALPALLAAAAAATVLLLGGRVHAFEQALRHVLGLNPAWVGAGAVFEVISLAGYVGLLALVAGRATPRVGARESAQITLAGAAATRLLPTAGAGGAALTVWTLRRAGLPTRAATRTLLAFLVLLYCVFLASIVVAGAALGLGLVASKGPTALSAIPAAVALIGIAGFVLIGRSGGGRTAKLMGDAVRDACRLVRSGDWRLAGAVVYWLFDGAVLWSMLHAFGSSQGLAVVALAYFVGQVANTLPIPGSVSGGMAGVLIAFGVPAGLALPAVLAYRTIAVWLPTPAALASVPGLRATVARWGREEAAPASALS